MFRILMPNGEFSKGGDVGGWQDNGKVVTSKLGKWWRFKQHVKTHLLQYRKDWSHPDELHRYNGAIVIEYELVEKRRIPIEQFIKEEKI